MSLQNGNWAQTTYMGGETQNNTHIYIGVYVCVCFFSETELSVSEKKASKYMRSAIRLCLALARLGQPHSKFPEGEQGEKRFHADKSLAQIKRQISGKDKRCWLAENNRRQPDTGIRGAGLRIRGPTQSNLLTRALHTGSNQICFSKTEHDLNSMFLDRSLICIWSTSR